MVDHNPNRTRISVAQPGAGGGSRRVRADDGGGNRSRPRAAFRRRGDQRPDAGADGGGAGLDRFYSRRQPGPYHVRDPRDSRTEWIDGARGRDSQRHGAPDAMGRRGWASDARGEAARGQEIKVTLSWFPRAAAISDNRDSSRAA